MQLLPEFPSSPFAVRAAAAALLAVGASCRARDVAAPAPERVVYVSAPPAPPAPPQANPQTMVENPTPPPAVNTAIPVQPATSAPAAAPPPAPLQESVVVTQAPPAPVVETIAPCPGPTYVWVGGRWVWRDHWIWAPGFWSPRPWNHAVWVEGHWVRRRHEWVWVNGHWR